ncbi:MAG: sensor domain-containing diguanylate cyclase [Myxococcota bacterium]|nr:sensor domain-containing diguanylate cyclase [Myxococcota bacterium]
MRKPPDAIAELARTWRRHEGDTAGALRAITETAASALEVGRAGVWLLDPGRDQMTCADLYEAKEARHSSGMVLKGSDFPAYFASLASEETLVADDAHTDARTYEFSPGYLTPFGIGALLDAPIRSGLRLVGVLCNEHIGAARTWTAAECKDAAFLGSLASLTLELENRASREALLMATLESSGEGIIACDEQRVLAFNRRFVEMWKLDVDALRDVAVVRARIASQTHGLSTEPWQANEVIAATGGESVDVLELLDGRVLERSSRPQLVADQVVGRVWSFRDITRHRHAEASLQASEAKLRDLAVRDGLTGLYNRRYILEQLDEAIQRSSARGERLTLALIDIDFFKKINDRLGHLAGDAVLRDFSQHLEHRLREADLVGRYGGEEFVIVLRGATLEAARRVLEQVRSALGDRPAQGELPRYTFSAGLAALGPDGGTPTDLLAKADERLYEAKRGGRDRIV